MRSLMIVTASILAASTATADPKNGGFKGPDSTTVVTVAEAANLADERTVKIQGYIVKSLGDEKYELQDDTGTLTVEIDDEDWRGIEVTPSDRVEVRGEIDKEWKEIELDADHIQLAQ